MRGEELALVFCVRRKTPRPQVPSELVVPPVSEAAMPLCTGPIIIAATQGRPLTQSDLDELQKLFVDAGVVENDDFQRVRELPDMPDFIRSLVGLDRRAARAAFNGALSSVTLSARQIDFVEQILDHLTASGTMDPALLYEPPFTDGAPNGVSDVFERDVVTTIVDTLADFGPRIDIAL